MSQKNVTERSDGNEIKKTQISQHINVTAILTRMAIRGKISAHHIAVQYSALAVNKKSELAAIPHCQ